MAEFTVCPYCKEPAVLKTGKDIYPHREDLKFVKIWVCTPCNARVGCHDGTDKAKGTLANPELRKLRIQAHSVFDPLWRCTTKKRSDAYTWLAKKLGINPSKCHIGSFNKPMCERVIKLCQNR